MIYRHLNEILGYLIVKQILFEYLPTLHVQVPRYM